MIFCATIMDVTVAGDIDLGGGSVDRNTAGSL
jgi:hypothetical protein